MTVIAFRRAVLPPQYGDWQQYLRGYVVLPSVDPARERVQAALYGEHRAKLFRTLVPGEADVVVVRYVNPSTIIQRYGRFHFRLFDLTTGRKPLVRFADFALHDIDANSGSVQLGAIRVFPFDQWRERIMAATERLRAEFASESARLWSEWEPWKPRYQVEPTLYRERYGEYLRSREWGALRAQVLDRDGHRCRVCNGESGVQVHHRTYENVGRETLDDLTAICRGCHAIYHGKAES